MVALTEYTVISNDVFFWLQYTEKGAFAYPYTQMQMHKLLSSLLFQILKLHLRQT